MSGRRARLLSDSPTPAGSSSTAAYLHTTEFSSCASAGAGWSRSHTGESTASPCRGAELSYSATALHRLFRQRLLHNPPPQLRARAYDSQGWVDRGEAGARQGHGSDVLRGGVRDGVSSSHEGTCPGDACWPARRADGQVSAVTACRDSGSFELYELLKLHRGVARRAWHARVRVRVTARATLLRRRPTGLGSRA